MNKKLSTEIEKFLDKAMYDYGCVFQALAEDDIEIIERCERELHKSHRNETTTL